MPAYPILLLAAAVTATAPDQPGNAPTAPQEIVQPIPPDAADANDAGFRAYLDSLRSKAAELGVSAATMNAVFPTLRYNPRVVALDRAQPGGGSFEATIPPFEPYRRKHVDAARISGGQQAWRANRAKLIAIEQETGVPEAIMV